MKKRILFLMDRWDSAAGGIQTVNRELVSAIPTSVQISRTVIVPYATNNEIDDAFRRGIELISGNRENDWSSILLSPEVRGIDPSSVLATVGHSYFSGREAFDLRNSCFPGALSVQFVHTSPLHVESHKEHKRDNYVEEREEKVRQELAIAERSDLVICIGPRLHRAMHDLLVARKKNSENVRAINCGISRSADPIRTLPIKPTLLCIGRTESTGVKGLDIFAYAAGYLTDMWSQHPSTRSKPAPQFVVRGVKDRAEEFEHQLVALAEAVGPRPNIIVRPYTSNREDLAADLRGATAFIMPSREEGFGLVACEAISLGVPTLVSENSGIAEVIKELARKSHMNAQCVISMAGDTKSVAKRFADAALKILVDERNAIDYCNTLSERLLPVSSWEVGALQLIREIERASSQQIELSQPEKQKSANAELAREPIAVLNKNRKNWNELPGLVTMSIQEAVVLTFEPGLIPGNIPSEINGVPIILREGMPIQATSGPHPAEDRLLVDDRETATVTLLGVGPDNTAIALTAAHALEGHSGKISVRIAGEQFRAHPLKVHVEQDWALLSVHGASITAPRLEIDSPVQGQQVKVRSAAGVLRGKVDAFEVSATVAGPSNRLWHLNGLFAINVHGVVAQGTSGSLVITDEGRAIGMVVAAASREPSSKETYALAAPLSPILHALRELGGNAEVIASVSGIAVMPTNALSLQLLLKELHNVRRLVVNDRPYFEGQLHDSTASILVAPVPPMGNIGSAIATTTLILQHDIRRLFVVGLCGGLHANKQRLGDVVVSSDVIYYEPGIYRDEGEQTRFRVSGTTPASILLVAKELRDMHASRDHNGLQIHIGSFASGEKVIRSQTRFSSINSHWGNLLAVEMEGAGVFEAASSARQDIGVVVIRGIADFADANKHDIARPHAAENAVAVTLEIIQRLIGGVGRAPAPLT